jgi:hypothetical protein
MIALPRPHHAATGRSLLLRRLIAIAFTISLAGVASAAPPDPPDAAQRSAQRRGRRARPHRNRSHHGGRHHGHDAPPAESTEPRDVAPPPDARPAPAPRDRRDPLIPLPF